MELDMQINLLRWHFQPSSAMAFSSVTSLQPIVFDTPEEVSALPVRVIPPLRSVRAKIVF